MKQFTVTPAGGKRLIAKAMAIHPHIRSALDKGTLVIIAGTTNGYIAEEILASIGQAEDFSRKRFFRGIILPPHRPATESGRLADTSGFPGDVVIVNGRWEKGKTIFDVADSLKSGDVVLKGLNALNYTTRKGAILIGDPKGGTIGAALQAVVGRRVRLILPAGLEKRIDGNIDELALTLNDPTASGPRLLPVPGQVFTEIQAIQLLTGAKAELVASGGVCGAEGSLWLAVSGDQEQMKAIESLMKTIASEQPFQL